MELQPEVGDEVTYRMFGGGLRTITVTGVDSDLKNGRSGFYGTNESGSWWGYDSQITRINKKTNV